MRDIRADLQERLGLLAKERQSLQSRLSAIEWTEASVKALFEHEQQRLQASGNGSGQHDRVGSTPLANLILKTVYLRMGEWLSLSDFKEVAAKEHFDFEGKSPGRTLHWALVGLTENRYLECQGSDGDRRYRLLQVGNVESGLPT